MSSFLEFTFVGCYELMTRSQVILHSQAQTLCDWFSLQPATEGYTAPLEGLLLDPGLLLNIFGGAAIFSFVVIKMVDGHYGLCLPGNLFHVLFQSNMAYHHLQGFIICSYSFRFGKN